MNDASGGPRPWVSRALGIALVLLLVGGAYAFWRGAGEAGEAHAVRDQVRRLETAVRDHDSRVLDIIEESHGEGTVPGPITEEDREHRRVLDILERLSHSQDFRLDPCHVHVDGDKALAACDVQGRQEAPPALLRNSGVPAALPRAIHIQYRRSPQGWGLWSIEPVHGSSPAGRH